MTIGQYGYDVSKGLNPDFLTLKESKAKLCEDLGLDAKEVELSMGMSTDFEHAVSLEIMNTFYYPIRLIAFNRDLFNIYNCF